MTIREHLVDLHQRYARLGFDVVLSANVDSADWDLHTWVLASWEPGYKRVFLDGYPTRLDLEDHMSSGYHDDGADYDAATIPLLAMDLTTGERYALRASYDLELAGPFGNDFRIDGFTDGMDRPVC